VYNLLEPENILGEFYDKMRGERRDCHGKI